MGIFSNKIEMSKKIKAQEAFIEQLNLEKDSQLKYISELRTALSNANKKNAEYKKKFINTNLECEFCYTTLQHEFIFCPKCGKKIIKSQPHTANIPRANIFGIEDDMGYALITKYNGFNDKKIVIPSSINGKSVIGIWNGVFEKCVDLEEVIIEEGCKYIGKNAFAGCKKLKRIRLPKSLLEIGDHAFSQCESLTEMAIPPNVTVIGQFAFSYCENLKKILLPDKLTCISSCMLSNTAISEIDIPQSVLHIGYSAFSDTKLTHIELPHNLYSISNYAFDIPGLKEIIIHSNVKIINRDIFGDKTRPTIYCSAGSKAHLYARKYGLDCKEIPAKRPVNVQAGSTGIIIVMGSFGNNASLEVLHYRAGIPKAATWSWNFKWKSRMDIEKNMSMNEARQLAGKLRGYIDAHSDYRRSDVFGKIMEFAVCEHWGESDV